MNSRTWINVALGAGVAALAAVVWLGPGRQGADYLLSGFKAGEVKAIRVEKAGREIAQLARGADGWRLVQPFSARADATQVQKLTAILDAKTTDKLAATGLARYDLDPPFAKLTIDGQAFSFGSLNPVVGAQYVLTNNAIYLLPPRYAAAIPDEAPALASKQLFAASEAPTAIALPNFRVESQDGKWALLPARGDPLSQDDLARWVDEWRLASALAVGGAPQMRAKEIVRVTLKDGRVVELDILQREPDLVLARRDEMLTYRIAQAAGQRMLAPPAAPQAVDGKK
jgi:hypothetical protein